jgi:2-polyprenyl-3-methyl-5-hydroxy-6-metoxy-1,4-benzoquinol methylase
MQFKEKLYKNYISTHNEFLQGDVTLKTIEKSFPVFDFYYKNLLPQDKSALILDIGCGNGNFVYYLMKRGYDNVYGIDISEEQIYAGKLLGIDQIEIANLLEFLSKKKDMYDCIIARDVIEHFTKPEVYDILKLISSALKENGTFIMQVPNGEGIFYTSIFYGDYTHEMAYTYKSVRQIFLNTGFSQANCYPVNPYSGNWKGRVRSFLWKIKIFHTRFWKMVESGSSKGIFTSNIIAVGTKL